MISEQMYVVVVEGGYDEDVYECAVVSDPAPLADASAQAASARLGMGNGYDVYLLTPAEALSRGLV